MANFKYLDPIKSWLMGLGVPSHTAMKAAKNTVDALNKGGALPADELHLLSAFAGSGTSSVSSDGQLAAVVKRQKMFPTPPPAPPPNHLPVPYPTIGSHRPKNQTTQGSSSSASALGKTPASSGDEAGTGSGGAIASATSRKYARGFRAAGSDAKAIAQLAKRVAE